jgi:rhodanese-related sulfurtransferase
MLTELPYGTRSGARLFACALISMFALGFAIHGVRGGSRGQRSAPQEDGEVRIAVISLAAAAQRFERDDVIFLDAQPSSFHALRRIPGARNLSREDFATDIRRIEPELRGSGRPLLVYCSDEACEDSTLVAARLAGLGFREIMLFKGGIDQWEASGMPVESDQ